MSVAIEADEAEQDRLALIVKCRYCGLDCRNQAAEYSHFRTCAEHPKTKK